MDWLSETTLSLILSPAPRPSTKSSNLGMEHYSVCIRREHSPDNGWSTQEQMIRPWKARDLSRAQHLHRPRTLHLHIHCHLEPGCSAHESKYMIILIMRFTVSALVLATCASAAPIVDLSGKGVQGSEASKRGAKASPTIKNGVVDTAAVGGPGDDWLTKRQSKMVDNIFMKTS